MARCWEINIVSLISSAIAFILNLASFGSPSWVRAEGGGSSLELGVWKLCLSHWTGLELCSSLTSDWQMAVQAMLCLGTLSAFVALILLLLFVAKATCKTKVCAIAICCCTFGTVVFNIIGQAIFTHYLNPSQIPSSQRQSFFSWGFGLGWAVSVIYLLIAFHLGAGAVKFYKATSPGQ